MIKACFIQNKGQWNQDIDFQASIPGGVPYGIDYSISGSNIWVTASTLSTNFSLDKLRPSTAYEAKVHMNCINEKAPYVSLHFETDLYEHTTLFPNPTDNKKTIHPSQNLIGNQFVIYDNTGRRAAKGELFDYITGLVPSFSWNLFL